MGIVYLRPPLDPGVLSRWLAPCVSSKDTTTIRSQGIPYDDQALVGA